MRIDTEDSAENHQPNWGCLILFIVLAKQRRSRQSCLQYTFLDLNDAEIRADIMDTLP